MKEKAMSEATSKAIELYEKFYYGIPKSTDSWLHRNAKECAVIAVDEIIENDPINPVTNSHHESLQDRVDDAIAFWKEVKKEIELI